MVCERCGPVSGLPAGERDRHAFVRFGRLGGRWRLVHDRAAAGEVAGPCPGLPEDHGDDAAENADDHQDPPIVCTLIPFTCLLTANARIAPIAVRKMLTPKPMVTPFKERPGSDETRTSVLASSEICSRPEARS